MEPSIFQTYSGGPYDVCIRGLPLYNSIQKPLKSLVYEGLTDEWTNCCLSCLIPVIWLGYTSYSYFDSGEGSFVAGLSCILYQFLVSGFLSFCCISSCLKGDTELQYLKHLLIIPPNSAEESCAGTQISWEVCGEGKLFFFDHINQDTKHSIILLVIPAKLLSGNPAANWHMDQGLLFTTEWPGICLLLSPWHYEARYIHCSIEGESHLLRWMVLAHASTSSPSLSASSHHISTLRVWKKSSCETVISGSLVQSYIASYYSTIYGSIGEVVLPAAFTE